MAVVVVHGSAWPWMEVMAVRVAHDAHGCRGSAWSCMAVEGSRGSSWQYVEAVVVLGSA